MKNNSFFGAILLATITLDSSVAFADNALPPILISKARTESVSLPVATNIEVISRTQIQSSGASTVTDLIRGHAGIQIEDSFGDGSTATIDMRGFGATAISNVLVMVDGRRLNNSGDTGTLDLNTIDIDNIERIEIVEGSAGVLFGNQAVGGVINIITRDPTTTEVTVRIDHGRHGGLSGIQLHAADQYDSGINYRVTVKQQGSHNYRDNNNHQLHHGALRIGMKHSDGEVFAEYERTHEKLELPGSLIESELIADRTQSSPFFAGDFSDTVSNIGRIGIRQSLSEQWKAEAEFTYRDNDRDFQNGFRSFFFIAAPSSQSRVTRSINPRLVGTLPFRGQNATLTIGSDYEDTGYTLVSQLGTQTLEQRIVAAFAQTIVPLTEKVTATGGLRRARVNNDIVSAPAFGETEAGDIDDTVSAFSAGIVYKPVNNVKLFARVDENYRFATVEEHIDPTFIYPVPEPLGLDTQTGLSKEVGVQLTADSAMLKISAYRIDLDNEIIFDAAAFSSTNLDETRREGFTVSGNWSPTSGVTLSGAYSYVDAEITDGSFSGSPVPLVAQNTYRLDLTIQANQNWSYFIEGIAATSRAVGGDFMGAEERLPSYAIGNAAIHYRHTGWMASLRVNNLFDTEYNVSASSGFDENFAPVVGFFPAAERNFMLSVNIDLTS